MSMLQGLGAKWLVAQADPGRGKPPPGTVRDGLNTILGWAKYTGLTVGVLGFIVVGAIMTINFRRGSGGEHGAALGWVMAGCLVMASASGFVVALT